MQMDIKKNVLIVDDNPNNLRLLSQMLVERDYKVRAVLNGLRALAAVQSSRPDIILLDVMMPEMDGYEVCARLRADPTTADIPIIFISALGETEDKIRAFEVGGVDYVSKPFQVDEVLARLETHLGLRDLRRELELANARLEEQVEQLNTLNARLQAQNTELDAFAHTVAHDIKNPLNLVLGHAELLTHSGEVSSEPGQESLRAIAAAGKKINNIIEALLVLHGVRKAQDVRFAPLDMAAIVREAWGQLEDLAYARAADITLPTSWPVVWGHAPWVEEVWANYLSNAIKYGGEPPRIQVGARELSGGQVRFWVQDNGVGLTDVQQAELFVPFERLEQARIAGHGLGLSIVRRIVERLGGQVGVESVPGGGSLFSFTLSCTPPDMGQVLGG